MRDLILRVLSIKLIFISQNYNKFIQINIAVVIFTLFRPNIWNIICNQPYNIQNFLFLQSDKIYHFKIWQTMMAWTPIYNLPSHPGPGNLCPPALTKQMLQCLLTITFQTVVILNLVQPEESLPAWQDVVRNISSLCFTSKTGWWIFSQTVAQGKSYLYMTFGGGNVFVSSL